MYIPWLFILICIPEIKYTNIYNHLKKYIYSPIIQINTSMLTGTKDSKINIFWIPWRDCSLKDLHRFTEGGIYMLSLNIILFSISEFTLFYKDIHNPLFTSSNYLSSRLTKFLFLSNIYSAYCKQNLVCYP